MEHQLPDRHRHLQRHPRPTPAPIRNTDIGDYTGLAFHAGVLVRVWADNSNSTGDNPAGANSSFDLYTALVHVTSAQVAPAVTTQPAPVTVAAGSPFSFAAASSGLPIPTVQWQRSNGGGTTFVDIAGARPRPTGPAPRPVATAPNSGPCSPTAPERRRRLRPHCR